MKKSTPLKTEPPPRLLDAFSFMHGFLNFTNLAAQLAQLCSFKNTLALKAMKQASQRFETSATLSQWMSKTLALQTAQPLHSHCTAQDHNTLGGESSPSALGYSFPGCSSDSGGTELTSWFSWLSFSYLWLRATSHCWRILFTLVWLKSLLRCDYLLSIHSIRDSLTKSDLPAAVLKRFFLTSLSLQATLSADWMASPNEWSAERICFSE